MSGRRAGRDGRRGSDDPVVRISRTMSYLLRHAPEQGDLVLDGAGWVAVDELLRALGDRGLDVDRALLEAVVRTNDKKRFELDVLAEGGERIRASQGHSVAVDLGYAPGEPPAVLYHGTPRRNLPAIREQGLRKGQRHHVHLSAEVATAAAVGRRRGEAVVLRVDAAAMAADGHVFAVSTNGVWLVDHVPPGYLDESDEA